MKRRDVIAGLVAAGAALTAGLYRFTDLFVKHYPPTPYDDVLAALVDRGQAVKVGEALVTNLPHGGDPGLSPENIAKELRRRLNGHDLRDVVLADVAAGKTVEINGWVLPETVALLAALAAKV